MSQLAWRDRQLLFLWYVKQIRVEDIGAELGISRRQFFRRRSSALKFIVDAGIPLEDARRHESA